MSTIVHGADLALNHGAIVQLTDGVLTGHWYYTDIVGAFRKGETGGHAARVPVFKTSDRQQKMMLRLAWLENWMDKNILIPHPPDIAGIEDYALDASHGAHYKGELGGIARILLWFRGIPFRLVDPISVKMFTTWDGTAQKDLVELKVKERWGVDFSKYNSPPNAKTGKVNRQTSEDLCDAYAVAQVVWAEHQLRKGEITLKDLGHDKERRVFIRVTKSYPVNVLDREWIQNEKGNPKPHGGLRPRIEAKIKMLEAHGAKSAAKMLQELLTDG